MSHLLHGEKSSAEQNYFVSVGIFIAVYAAGTILPLNATPHYYNRMSRVWNWTEILLTLQGISFIVRTRNFKPRQAATALLLGAVCLVSLFRDPRTAEIIVTGICTAVTFYAGCILFELTAEENRSERIGVICGIRSFLFGAAVSVPLALVNVIYLSMSRPVHISDVLLSTVFALKPAIAEEVVFHFYLLAYAYFLLRKKPDSRTKTMYIYALLVIPRELLHYPDLFARSPGMAVLMTAVNCLLFGLPMAFLMKRKNLQAAVGMHWFVDFIRFAAGF